MRKALAALLGAAASYAGAQDPPPEIDPVRVEGTAPWGTIRRVMEPAYPQALKDAKAKVWVDVSGRVAFNGQLVDVIYTPGSEEAKAMVEPLGAVMRHWRFVTPQDRYCRPSDVVVKNRIWFDFDEERPKLSVTHQPGSPHASRSIKALDKPTPKYPRSMQVQGWQAYVFSRLTIDSEGKVIDAIATAYPREEKVDLSDFEKSTIQAARGWTFNPQPGSANRYACYEFVYRLKD